MFRVGHYLFKLLLHGDSECYAMRWKTEAGGGRVATGFNVCG